MFREVLRKLLLLPLVLLAVLLLPLLMQACSESSRPEYFAQTYKIWVDSLTVATEPAVGDTLVVRCYGYIGPNDCHSFAGFGAKTFPRRVELTLWTRYFREINTGCEWTPVYLLGEPYRVAPDSAGVFEIVVRQPDGSTLSHLVQVQEGGGS